MLRGFEFIQLIFNLFHFLLDESVHRPTSRGRLGDVAPELGKAIIFGQMLNISGRASSQKWKTCFLDLLNENTEFIPSSEMNCPKSGFLPIIIGWGESGKTILNEALLSVIM